jgi:hypothetical protein
MNGFAGADAAGTAATWVAAAATLAVWSYAVGGGRVFRLAQYLLAGLATGYLTVIAVREVLVPMLLDPLARNPAGQPLLWLGLLLAAGLVAGRWLPPLVPAVPIALLVAATAAFALGGAVVGTLLPQLGATIVDPDAGPGDILNAVLAAAITLLVLFSFLHGTRRGRISAAAIGAGRWLMLAGLGGWLGFLLVSRLTVLLERIAFLLGDWLGIG